MSDLECLARTQSCPRCGVGPGETCRTRTGGNVSDTTPAPSAETIAWTTHLAGCDEAVHRGQRLGWCITHGMKKRTPWPCPVAVDLAAKIEDRDRARDARTRAISWASGYDAAVKHRAEDDQ